MSISERNEMRKQRGHIDLGPPWIWKAAGWLILIGAVSVVGWVGYWLYWLVTHIQFMR